MTKTFPKNLDGARFDTWVDGRGIAITLGGEEKALESFSKSLLQGEKIVAIIASLNKFCYEKGYAIDKIILKK